MAQERRNKSGSKRKLDVVQSKNNEEEVDDNELADESVLRLPKWSKKDDAGKCVYFVLENAALESAKVSDAAACAIG